MGYQLSQGKQRNREVQIARAAKAKTTINNASGDAHDFRFFFSKKTFAKCSLLFFHLFRIIFRAGVHYSFVLVCCLLGGAAFSLFPWEEEEETAPPPKGVDRRRRRRRKASRP